MHRQVPGLHSVREAIKVRPKAIKELWLTQGFEKNSDLRVLNEWAKTRRINIQTKPDVALRKITEHHQGVVAIVNENPDYDLHKLKNNQYSRIVALDGITDPHNLGAVLRTSWLLGVDAIFLPENRSVSLTPTAIKVASGGAEHVPIVCEGNLANSLKDLKEQGYWVFGLDHTGEQKLHEVKFPEKVVLVIGAEDKGMKVPVKNSCDALIAIPQSDPKASFNASVATSIGLYEVFRQHQNPLK